MTEVVDATHAYRTMGPSVWRVLERMGVPRRWVEDATHDVFLIALRRWDDFRGDSSRRTWIMGIAVRVAANHRRKYRRSGEEPAMLNAEKIDLQPGNPAASPYEQTLLREASEQLQRLLMDLPQEQRALWVLVHCEDLAICEAAESLGLSGRRAYGLLERTQVRLEKALARLRAQDERRLR